MVSLEGSFGRWPRLNRWVAGAAVFMMGAALGAGLLRAQDTSKGRAGDEQNKEIELKTPWGSLEATATPDPAKLGLPIYPGARFLKDENRGPLGFSISVKGKPDIHFLIGKFQTADSLEKVRAFYQKKLGSAITKFDEKTDDGGQAFEMKHNKDNRYVQLKPVAGGTEIDLVRTQGVEDDEK
jgi:hypothetical protein